MGDLHRIALQGLLTRLSSAPIEHVRILEKLAERMQQLGAISWVRHGAGVDTKFHLVGISAGSMVSRCNGRWPFADPFETALDGGPPLDKMCGECARRWARGKDVNLYGLLDLAHELAMEDVMRAALHEDSRAELVAGLADLEALGASLRQRARDDERHLAEVADRPIGSSGSEP